MAGNFCFSLSAILRRSWLSGPNKGTNTQSNQLSTSENVAARGARDAAEPSGMFD